MQIYAIASMMTTSTVDCEIGDALSEMDKIFFTSDVTAYTSTDT